ncbi:hypothetical protein Glove_109g41 [Diversispora epigaea]|uniref:Protein kinase domain-containing protein n=1 Tax=Diversispora epigaea TaxID=1348612 RepID=A0A397J280_9GLOM|nr:hypothetical protein Glove_109g41 [Diversispora epigaea]
MARSKHFKDDFDKWTKWKIENQRLKRYGQEKVVLNKFDDLAGLNEEFLNEVKYLSILFWAIGQNLNNPEKKIFFGALPYIAPEVLGGEEYTQAADVYSFGIVAYEIVTDLAMKICNGLRPKIPFHVPKLITRIIMCCWDARVTHRPTFKELYKLYNKLFKYYSDYYYEYNEITIQIKKAEEFSTSTNASIN